jgi:hypothetical protein
MRAAGMDALVVYADREHNANLTWVCGYDPRFEEALLVFGLNEMPALLVGNEGWGYAELCPSPVRRYCTSRSACSVRIAAKLLHLHEILTSEGLRSGMTVGVAGWKYFSEREFEFPDNVL